MFNFKRQQQQKSDEPVIEIATPEQIALMAAKAKPPEMVAAEANLKACHDKQAELLEQLRAEMDFAPATYTVFERGVPVATPEAKRAAAARADNLQKQVADLRTNASNLHRKIEAYRPTNVAAVRAAVEPTRLSAATELVRLADEMVTALAALNATAAALSAAGASTPALPVPPYIAAIRETSAQIVSGSTFR